MGPDNFFQLFLLKLLTGIYFISMDHVTDPLCVKCDPRIFDDPRRIQHVNEFIRHLLGQYVIEPADAVAARRQDDSVILSF